MILFSEGEVGRNGAGGIDHPDTITRKSMKPSKPIPIKKEIVNEDPIRESMEDLAEKLYGSKAAVPTSRPDDDISAISSSLREALMEDDPS